MRPLILSAAGIIFLSCTCQIASAQVGGRSDCPAVTVSCPDDPSTDKPSAYRVNVTGGSAWVTPTYTWKASGGRVTGGQGSPEVTIDPEGSGHLTVTVEVGGYPAACNASASCSWFVCHVTSRKVDEYGDIGFADERERLNQFATELRNDPTAAGFILVYAGRRARGAEAQRRGERARSYLLEEHGLEGDRVVVVDGGHREARTVELFIAPVGAAEPVASPTVEPGAVEFIDRKVKERGRNARP